LQDIGKYLDRRASIATMYAGLRPGHCDPRRQSAAGDGEQKKSPMERNRSARVTPSGNSGPSPLLFIDAASHRSLTVPGQMLLPGVGSEAETLIHVDPGDIPAASSLQLPELAPGKTGLRRSTSLLSIVGISKDQDNALASNWVEMRNVTYKGKPLK
jgi:hypothetical protein